MKRKSFWLTFPFLCLFLFRVGYGQQDESLININKVSFLSSKLNTKIILESDSPLAIAKTAYSQESPKTLIIYLGKVQMFPLPPISAGESQFLKDMRLQKTADGELILSIDLAERVPYRIQDGARRTVIELDEIQRTEGDYLIDPEAQLELEKSTRAEFLLNKVDISEKSDQVNVTANLGQKAITNVFALENPFRLVVDIFDTVYANPTLTYPINKLGVEKIKIGQFQLSDPYSITRLVFDLKEPKYYALSSRATDLILTFFKDQELSLETEPAAKIDSLALAEPTPLQSEKVEPEEKPAKEPVKTEAEPAKEVPSAPKEQEAKEPSPAKSIEDTELLSKYASVNPPQVVVPGEQKKEEKKEESKPAEEPAQEDKFKPKVIQDTEEKYTGEILSLKFRDADLKDVILYLGERAGLNVIFDPEVKGVPITCNLEDVPWDQALDILLRNNKLGKSLIRNVLRIAPIDVLTEEETAQRKLIESQEEAGPLVHKTITLSYAKAKEVLELIKSKKSKRGEIIIDERTNTLIVSDVKEKIELLEKIISVVDTQTPQVSIEARIVEATSSFVRNLGIQWGFLGISDPFYGNQTALQFPNKVLADGALIPTGTVTKGIGGPLGGYAINLPAPSYSSAVGFSFANVLDTFRLDLALSALESAGEGKIISCPKITTQNNKEAEIIQGRQIPVQTVANFTVTTRYIFAALELKATPQITAEGTIIMTIEIQNNAADFDFLVQQIPVITTESAKTTVLVADGGTTVIGGIYRVEDSVTRSRVPFLHKIPILGNLFRSLAKTTRNRELLIFITPRIIK